MIVENDFHITNADITPGLRRKIADAARRDCLDVSTLAYEVSTALGMSKDTQDYAQLDTIFCFGADLRLCLENAPDLKQAFLDRFNAYASGRTDFATQAFLGGLTGLTFEASTPAFR